MKRNVQKALAISGLAIAIGTSGLTLPASANTGNGKALGRTAHERIVRTRKVERTIKTVITRRIVPGVVSSVSGNTITMTKGNKTYTINTDSATRFLNLKWQTIDSSSIQSGNKIRVLGTVSDNTITAKTVRDISL